MLRHRGSIRTDCQSPHKNSPRTVKTPLMTRAVGKSGERNARLRKLLLGSSGLFTQRSSFDFRRAFETVLCFTTTNVKLHR